MTGIVPFAIANHDKFRKILKRDDDIIQFEPVEAIFCTAPCTLSYTINNTTGFFNASLNFMGDTYDFYIKQFTTKHRTRVLEEMYKYYESSNNKLDPTIFGSFVEGRGCIYNPEQLVNCILRFSIDVVFTWAKIWDTHKSCTWAAASQYREKYRNGASNYDQWVTRTACHCIIHSKFHSTKEKLKEVTFTSVTQ